jgi:hypothetical protein
VQRRPLEVRLPSRERERGADAERERGDTSLCVPLFLSLALSPFAGSPPQEQRPPSAADASPSAAALLPESAYGAATSRARARARERGRRRSALSQPPPPSSPAAKEKDSLHSSAPTAATSSARPAMVCVLRLLGSALFSGERGFLTDCVCGALASVGGGLFLRRPPPPPSPRFPDIAPARARLQDRFIFCTEEGAAHMRCLLLLILVLDS